MISHIDWLPTILAAAGEPDIKEKLLKGHKAGDKTYKVHLDGYNQLPFLTGETDTSPRKEFFYFSDDGDLLACGTTIGKLSSPSSGCAARCNCGRSRSCTLRLPKIFNLRTDPFEFADVTSNTYWDWIFDHAYLLVPAQEIVGEFLATFKDYPPRQKAASFGVDQVLDKLTAGLSGG